MSRESGENVSGVISDFCNFIKDTPFASNFMPGDILQINHVAQQLKVPYQIQQWYIQASPRNFEIPTIGNSIPLWNEYDILDAQDGYRFHGITKESLTNWNQQWIVIGGEGPYPIIVNDSSVDDINIYYGEFSGKSWDLNIITSGLAGLLYILKIYIFLYSKYNLKDKGHLRSEFINEIKDNLSKNSLTKGHEDSIVHGLLGY
jgi:hypothetical protein